MKPYYQDSHCVIYHGDCRVILPELGRVDAVITDPPFSDICHKNAKSNRDMGYGNKAIDFNAIDFNAIMELLEILAGKCDRWFIATLDWRHIAMLEKVCPEPWEFVRFGVWVKTNPMPQISADRPANGWNGIAYLHNRATKKSWNGGGNHGNWIGPVITNGDHPTSKPVSMLATMVKRFTNSGDAILDPFMGVGTTLVAAKQLGRISVGIEMEERYCAIAAKRLEQEYLALESPPVIQPQPEPELKL